MNMFYQIVAVKGKECVPISPKIGTLPQAVRSIKRFVGDNLVISKYRYNPLPCWIADFNRQGKEINI